MTQTDERTNLYSWIMYLCAAEFVILMVIDHREKIANTAEQLIAMLPPEFGFHSGVIGALLLLYCTPAGFMTRRLQKEGLSDGKAHAISLFYPVTYPYLAIRGEHQMDVPERQYQPTLVTDHDDDDDDYMSGLVKRSALKRRSS